MSWAVVDEGVGYTPERVIAPFDTYEAAESAAAELWAAAVTAAGR